MLSLFQSFVSILGKWLQQLGNVLFEELYKARYLIAGLFISVISPIKFGLDFIIESLRSVDVLVQRLSSVVSVMDFASASSFWAGGGAIAGQVNAVVPLDYCFTVGAGVAAVWVVVQAIRLAVWVYSLIPLKAT